MERPLARPIEWLTYAQAAERLGLSPEAVRHRARRAGWRTMPGNDGRTLVLIPDDEVADIRPRAPVHTPDRTADHSPARTPGHDDQIARSNARAERADERADEANKRADGAMALADRTLAALAEANARAERAETGRGEAADQLALARAALDQAQGDARKARGEAEDLRRAEAARKAKGRLHRAWEAWRGR